MFKPVSSVVDFPALERELLEKWYKNGIVEKYLHKNEESDKKFSFLDGPITANNPMGVHHGWGRTYKDFWQRYKNMQGFQERFQNGFDEQGLWVEVEVEKELGLHNKKDIENLVQGDKFASIAKFINLCKERVKKYSAIQTDQSKRLGYFMDWEHSYHTSSDKNNYTIWSFIKVVNDKRWLYKGHDTVPWCPRCGTAISQHEILTEEYKEIVHETVYFKLPIRNRSKEFLLVWTTTPWTIPSNVAVAVNKKEIYEQYEYEDGFVWVMKKRLPELIKKGILQPNKQTITDSMPGSMMIGWEYDAPFDDLPLVKKSLGNYVHRIIDGGDVVTETEGTGLLHVAPGAGEEDFKLGKENGLPVIATIEEDATYMEGMSEFTGKSGKKHPEFIIDYLKAKDNGKFILKTEKYKHRYPTCWRCKAELVWRLVDEWYIAMDKPDESGKTFREQMVQVTKEITWMPSWAFDRELDWLKNMHDWLISKKRYWGLALPIWECKKCHKFKVIGSREELKEQALEGWDEFDGNSPHRPWIDLIKVKCDECGDMIERIPDVGNPWLDAGIVPFSTLPEGWFPAHFITESFPGQFKNWFYSLIAMSTALEQTFSFEKLLGYGTVRDEKGEEMHKSKGNSIEFNEAADKMGVDAMRWLYLRTNPEHNVNFGFGTLEEIRRLFLIKLWNVYSFLVTYANLYEFAPQKIDLSEFDSTNVLDKWILSRFSGNLKNITAALEKYDARDAMGHSEIFIDDLSNWYVRRIRDRVNKNDNKEDRELALQTLWVVLVEFTKVLAPSTPFIADEIFSNLTNKESVHLESWPTYASDRLDDDLEKKMTFVRRIVEEGLAVRKEKQIKVKQPLQAIIVTTVDEGKNVNSSLEQLIKEEVNVKNVVWKTGDISDSDSYSGEIEGIVYKVDLNIEITKELAAEGAARDIIRKIQQERKNLGTALNEKVNVTLDSWPEEFEDEIKRKALVDNLTKGEFTVKRI